MSNVERQGREGGNGKVTMKDPFSSMNFWIQGWQERFDLYCERTANAQKSLGKKADSGF